MDKSSEESKITPPEPTRGTSNLSKPNNLVESSHSNHSKQATSTGGSSSHAAPTYQPDLVTLDGLKIEVDRLNRELAQALQERSQSAAFGLELLNEKENLQQRLDSLETIHEQTKVELYELRDAWNKSLTDQKLSATTGIEQEERLLNESAALEASYTITIQEIERELKHTRNQLANANSDKERYLHERDELSKNIEILETERKNLKSELRDLKSRESRLFTENNELEEENVNLQKQVSTLRSSQVEFESSKHEIQRLREELEALNKQLDDVNCLQKITERETQKALEALQNEIEQKKTLKKELDKKCNTDLLINWTSLAALKGSSHFGGNVGRSASTHRKSQTIISKDDNNLTSDLTESVKDIYSDHDEASNIMQDLDMPSLEGSLFDEVHLTEIKKLQKTLDDNESQRHQLNSKIIDLQHKLDAKIREAESIEKRLSAICTLVKENFSDEEKISRLEKLGTDGSRETNEDDFELIYSYLNDILTDIKSHQDMSQIIANSKKNEARIKLVEDDIYLMLNLFSDFHNNVISTHDQLMTVSEELASVYHHVCQVNGEQPNQVILKHVQTDADRSSSSQETQEVVERESLASKFEAVRSRYSTGEQRETIAESGNISSSLKSLRSFEIHKLVETVKDQLRYLREALDKQIPNNHSNALVRPDSDAQATNSISSGGEDIANVQKLKALLSTKREQIAVLRNVLKTNKQTAEVALANLKSKYETEKAVVTETMAKLRHELKALKEDAATFASLRSMFSARCEELSAQIDDLESRLRASEQEKNTLNSILLIAIEQKITVKQKLEAMEMDREGSQMGANSSAPAKDGQMAGQNQFRSMARRASGRNLRQSRSMRISGNRRGAN